MCAWWSRMVELHVDNGAAVSGNYSPSIVLVTQNVSDIEPRPINGIPHGRHVTSCRGAGTRRRASVIAFLEAYTGTTRVQRPLHTSPSLITKETFPELTRPLSLPTKAGTGVCRLNGRHERMHRTLKAATAQPPAGSLRMQQQAFDAFEREYNWERPHEASQMKTPVSAMRLGRRYPSQLAAARIRRWLGKGSQAAPKARALDRCLPFRKDVLG
jgi:hypothetical protein